MFYIFIIYSTMLRISLRMWIIRGKRFQRFLLFFKYIIFCCFNSSLELHLCLYSGKCYCIDTLNVYSYFHIANDLLDAVVSDVIAYSWKIYILSDSVNIAVLCTLNSHSNRSFFLYVFTRKYLLCGVRFVAVVGCFCFWC